MLLHELGNPTGSCTTPSEETERERGRMGDEITNEWFMWCGSRGKIKGRKAHNPCGLFWLLISSEKQGVDKWNFFVPDV
jgi:hypothetical protein